MHRSLAAPALTRATSTIKKKNRSTHHVRVVNEYGLNSFLNVGFGVTSVSRSSAVFPHTSCNFYVQLEKRVIGRKFWSLWMEKPFVIIIILPSKPDSKCFPSCRPGQALARDDSEDCNCKTQCWFTTQQGLKSQASIVSLTCAHVQ